MCDIGMHVIQYTISASNYKLITILMYNKTNKLLQHKLEHRKVA